MNKKDSLHFFIIAGEDSGDLHGSQVIVNLKKMHKNVVFSGLGGPQMMQAGLVSLVSFDSLAVMGFVEIIKRIPFFLSLERLLLQHIKKTRPNKILLIDYPGLNLRLAKKIKQKYNIPIYYYISPQLWAWKENRLQIIKKYIDHMIVIFPFEKEWYKNRNVSVQFFGHPIIDLSQQYQISPKKRNKNVVVALCPGSRYQEVKKHLPIFTKLVNSPQLINKNISFILYLAPGISDTTVTNISAYKNVTIEKKPILQSFKAVDFAIIASGTATLESAIALTPMVVIYKMSLLSWLITKSMIKTKYASIVNILAKQKIVPELLQKECNTKNIINELLEFIQLHKSGKTQKAFNHIKALLGDGNAYKRTASFLINE